MLTSTIPGNAIIPQYVAFTMPSQTLHLDFDTMDRCRPDSELQANSGFPSGGSRYDVPPCSPVHSLNLSHLAIRFPPSNKNPYVESRCGRERRRVELVDVEVAVPSEWLAPDEQRS